MNDKLKELLFENTGLKILSLLIAIGLWGVCMNLNNPEMTQSYTLPVSLLNMNYVNENGMVILNENELSQQNVYVKIKATRSNLVSLDESRISASVDFSPLDITNSNNIGEKVPVSIYVSVPNINYEVVDYSPRVVDVVFDQLTTKDVPIDIVIEDEPAKNYELQGQNQVSPEYVTIQGAKTNVDDVDSAEVYVSVDNASQPIDDQYDITILSKEDDDITNKVSLSNQTANVNINIVKVDSLNINQPIVEGQAQDGYEVVGINWSPQVIEVVGDEAAIQELGSIELPSINITGAIDDVRKSLDLNAILEPLNISVREGFEDECTVIIDIEKVVTKTVELQTDNIVFENKDNFDFENFDLPDSIKVSVTAPENEMENFDSSTISGTADLSLYKEGDESIQVEVVCSNPLIEVSTPVRLSISKKNTE